MKHYHRFLIALGFIAGSSGTLLEPQISAIANDRPIGLLTPADNPTLRLADEIAPLYGLRPAFVRAIICKESYCGKRLEFRETSPAWSRVITGRLKIPAGSERYRELMTSYGAMGIGALWAYLEEGIEPAELYDDIENIHLGCKWLRRHFDACRGATIGEREFCAAARHNGGPRGMLNAAARAYASAIRLMTGKV